MLHSEQHSVPGPWAADALHTKQYSGDSFECALVFITRTKAILSFLMRRKHLNVL